MNRETPAQIAYQSYGNTVGNRNFLGDPMPDWTALSPVQQAAWQNATDDAIVASVTTPSEVDIYPVWLFADIKTWAGNPDRAAAWRRLLRDVRRGLRRRRYLIAGFHAEPGVWPDGLKRCGSGWTRGRALRDLRRRTARAAAGSGSEAAELDLSGHDVRCPSCKRLVGQFIKTEAEARRLIAAHECPEAALPSEATE